MKFHFFFSVTINSYSSAMQAYGMRNAGAIILNFSPKPFLPDFGHILSIENHLWPLKSQLFTGSIIES